MSTALVLRGKCMEFIESENSKIKERMRNVYAQKAESYGFNSEVIKAVTKNLREILPRSVTVGAYMAKDNEVNLSQLVAERTDVKFVYPTVLGDAMSFYNCTNINHFKSSKWGVLEPDPKKSQLINLEQVDLVLVPGVAFDRNGGRLGRGKGFYDKALQNFSGLKVGVSNVAQICEEDLPVEKHDVRMNLIVTDQFILRIFSS